MDDARGEGTWREAVRLRAISPEETLAAGIAMSSRDRGASAARIVRDPTDTANAFARACAAANVPCAFHGAVAAMVWGQPRRAAALEAMVILDPAQAPAFAEALTRHGLNSGGNGAEADLFRGATLVLSNDPEGLVVEVRLVSSPEERSGVFDAVPLRCGIGELRVARAEEALVLMLRGRYSRDDVGSILVRQAGKLDLQRLWALAATSNVRTALSSALAEAGSADPPETDEDEDDGLE